MNMNADKAPRKFPSRSSTAPPPVKAAFLKRLANKGPDVGRESLPARVPKKGQHNPRFL